MPSVRCESASESVADMYVGPDVQETKVGARDLKTNSCWVSPGLQEKETLHGCCRPGGTLRRLQKVTPHGAGGPLPVALTAGCISTHPDQLPVLSRDK